MGVFNVPLGVNLTQHNPVKESPFVLYTHSGLTNPPAGNDAILTEDGQFILTEDGEFITTE